MAGGRRLQVPARGVRPTAERVREALFNVLAARTQLAGAEVLDLYAGSGALGLEALSRGAAAVTLVESDARAAAVVARNIAAVALPGARVARTPVARFLAATPQRTADLVFADPPYALPAAELTDVLDAVTRRWVHPGSVLVLERGTGGEPPQWPPGWTHWPQRRYGDTVVDLAGRD